MPIFDFQCEVCEHVFEDLVSSIAPNPPCPKCTFPTNKLITTISNYTGAKTNFVNEGLKRLGPAASKFKE